MLGIAFAAASATVALLDLPAGMEELPHAEPAEVREWVPHAPRAPLPARVVLLAPARGLPDAPAAALDALFATLRAHCRYAVRATLARAGAAEADEARAEFRCPEHRADGRGLVELVRALRGADGPRIVKVAFGLSPFSRGNAPLTRAQRVRAVAILDSFQPPEVVP